jgi:hypothetical protein
MDNGSTISEGFNMSLYHGTLKHFQGLGRFRVYPSRMQAGARRSLAPVALTSVLIMPLVELTSAAFWKERGPLYSTC